ncbi:hypothetical protein DID88_005598 [Monilinia fructigena]|uniref:Amidase domain-containing protein n=1 Tax=Monilinia fructigena TaxID=38457 RepID=A0A395J088_9HELO|nr:hypothetical protein DID88_005598 [Monilinia fructigena]
MNHYIPVPSRLYSPLPSPSHPLSGKRIAVKDIFDLKGVKTTVCSKAYDALQDVSSETALSIQRLIDQGAVIIGKVKTTPFSSGMGPRDWVDYQAPFNPRACGYLDADCSSSGSGAALRALGSMVGPAASNGLFGIRPTHGRISGEGLVPVSTCLDTAGMFSRDISEFSAVLKSWLSSTNSTPPLTMPTKLTIFPQEFESYVPEVKQIMENFIQDFEKATQLSAKVVDINELWTSYEPGRSSQKSFTQYFENTLAHIQLYGHYNNTASFRAEYKKKFGSEPYAEPLLRYKWNLGANLTNSQHNTAQEQKKTFAIFLQKHIFDNGGIILLPYGQPDICYRDEYSGSVEEYGAKWQGYGVPVTAFLALGGAPPCRFLSDSEWTDEYLVDLVRFVLEISGRQLSVKTGKTAF